MARDLAPRIAHVLAEAARQRVARCRRRRSWRCAASRSAAGRPPSWLGRVFDAGLESTAAAGCRGQPGQPCRRCTSSGSLPEAGERPKARGSTGRSSSAPGRRGDRELREVVSRQPGGSTETFSCFGLGPRYRVIDASRSAVDLPEIGDFGERRVPGARRGRFAGDPWSQVREPRAGHACAGLRDRRLHEFRDWTWAGHAYAALSTPRTRTGTSGSRSSRAVLRQACSAVRTLPRVRVSRRCFALPFRGDHPPQAGEHHPHARGVSPFPLGGATVEADRPARARRLHCTTKSATAAATARESSRGAHRPLRQLRETSASSDRRPVVSASRSRTRGTARSSAWSTRSAIT